MEATESGLARSIRSPALISSVAFGKALRHFPLQIPWSQKRHLSSIRHVSYKSLVLLFPTVFMRAPLTLKEVSGNT